MVVWNAEADAKLLFAILKTAKPKIDHDAVASYMDNGVSAYAVQHRLRKLNAMAQGKGPQPNTPSKAKPEGSGTTPLKTPTKSGNTSGKKRQGEEVTGEEQLESTPTKKPKNGKPECDAETF